MNFINLNSSLESNEAIFNDAFFKDFNSCSDGEKLPELFTLNEFSPLVIQQETEKPPPASLSLRLSTEVQSGLSKQVQQVDLVWSSHSQASDNFHNPFTPPPSNAGSEPLFLQSQTSSSSFSTSTSSKRLKAASPAKKRRAKRKIASKKVVVTTSKRQRNTKSTLENHPELKGKSDAELQIIIEKYGKRTDRDSKTYLSKAVKMLKNRKSARASRAAKKVLAAQKDAKIVELQRTEYQLRTRIKQLDSENTMLQQKLDKMREFLKD